MPWPGWSRRARPRDARPSGPDRGERGPVARSRARQYLVTSPVPLCADSLHNPVKPVPIPARFATAMLTTAEQLLGTPQRTVPLALALEKAERHKELSATFDRKTVLDKVLGELTKG